jgi:hypothetical protein
VRPLDAAPFHTITLKSRRPFPNTPSVHLAHSVPVRIAFQYEADSDQPPDVGFEFSLGWARCTTEAQPEPRHWQKRDLPDAQRPREFFVYRQLIGGIEQLHALLQKLPRLRTPASSAAD